MDPGDVVVEYGEDADAIRRRRVDDGVVAGEVERPLAGFDEIPAEIDAAEAGAKHSQQIVLGFGVRVPRVCYPEEPSGDRSGFRSRRAPRRRKGDQRSGPRSTRRPSVGSIGTSSGPFD